MKIFLEFLGLGLTSFGGPTAHIAVFRRHFVEKKSVFSESSYANLVALCQVIPGPASSQVGMAIGYRLNGFFGAFWAWLGFTLPSFIFMSIAGYLVLSGHVPNAGWVVVALKSFALGIVTQAVIGMWRALCTDHNAKIIAIIAALIFYYSSMAWSQIGLIAVALLIGHLAPHHKTNSKIVKNRSPRRIIIGILLLSFFSMVLAATIFVKGEHVLWNLFSGHYLSGALVFGGGHVVLPLLQAEFVPSLSEDLFFTGYGLAQVMPGPLFTLAGYIGSLIFVSHPVVGAIVAICAIFIPGALILAASSLLGAYFAPWLQSRLRFVNAVVVGLLLSVLVNPLFTSSVYDEVTSGLAILSLGLAVGLKRSPLETASALLGVSFVLSLGAFI